MWVPPSARPFYQHEPPCAVPHADEMGEVIIDDWLEARHLVPAQIAAKGLGTEGVILPFFFVFGARGAERGGSVMDIASRNSLSPNQISRVVAQIAASFTTRLHATWIWTATCLHVLFLKKGGAPSVEVLVGRVGLCFFRGNVLEFEGREKPDPDERSGVADCAALGPSTSEAVERALAVDIDCEGGLAHLASIAMA